MNSIPYTELKSMMVFISLCGALDMLALKLIALTLAQLMADHLPKTCYHVKGSGGLKHAVRLTKAAAHHHTYVVRADIKGYYESIRFDVLMHIISTVVKHPILLTLIEKALHRTEVQGGVYYGYHQKGIPKGSPLSPILGAIALLPLDQAMGQRNNIFYARFMDDWIVFTKSKTALRRIIKLTHDTLRQIHLTLHPTKTYIGKIAHGVNFLGYFVDHHRLLPSKETLRRFHERAVVLYEHPTEPLKRLRHTSERDISEYSAHEPPPNDNEMNEILTSLLQRGGNSRWDILSSKRIRRYIDQWTRWVRVGFMNSGELLSSTKDELPSLYDLWRLQRPELVS
jgi:hypothetical protein